MLGIGHEYRNTPCETTGNAQVVLLSSQHSPAVSSLVCVYNHFARPFYEKLSISFLFRHVWTHGVLPGL